MTFSEILHLVSQGQELPPFPNLPDQLCWQTLMNLKRAYDYGEINAARVRKEKQDISRAYEEYTEAYQQYVAVYREYGERRIRIGGKVQELLETQKNKTKNYRETARLAIEALVLALNEETAKPLLDIIKGE